MSIEKFFWIDSGILGTSTLSDRTVILSIKPIVVSAGIVNASMKTAILSAGTDSDTPGTVVLSTRTDA
jgi:hypothetical protein